MSDPSRSGSVIGGGGSSPRVSYGWVIVSITFMGMALVLGSRFCLGLFLPYMPEALNTSAASVSGAFAIAMLGAAVLQPLSGILLDRWGGRTVMTIGLAFAGTSLCGTALAMELWQVILFMGFASSVGYAFVSPVSTTSIVASWFETNRGTALGIATSGTKAAMVALPPVLAMLIAMFDWRTAMLALGATVWMLIPAVLIFVKPAPSQASLAHPSSGNTKATPLEGSTLMTALTMPSFWYIAISLFANGLVMNLVFIHLPNYLISQGHPQTLAALGLAVLGAVGIIGTMATGALSDWLGRRNVLLVMFGARGLTAILIVLAPGPLSLVVFVLVFGLLGYGAIGVVGALAAETFGKRAIGAILGSAYVFNQIGGAVGVYAGGASVEFWGDYSVSLWLAVATTLIAFIAILLIGRSSPAT